MKFHLLLTHSGQEQDKPSRRGNRQKIMEKTRASLMMSRLI